MSHAISVSCQGRLPPGRPFENIEVHKGGECKKPFLIGEIGFSLSRRAFKFLPLLDEEMCKKINPKWKFDEKERKELFFFFHLAKAASGDLVHNSEYFCELLGQYRPSCGGGAVLNLDCINRVVHFFFFFFEKREGEFEKKSKKAKGSVNRKKRKTNTLLKTFAQPTLF